MEVRGARSALEAVAQQIRARDIAQPAGDQPGRGAGAQAAASPAIGPRQGPVGVENAGRDNRSGSNSGLPQPPRSLVRPASGFVPGGGGFAPLPPSGGGRAANPLFVTQQLAVERLPTPPPRAEGEAVTGAYRRHQETDFPEVVLNPPAPPLDIEV